MLLFACALAAIAVVGAMSRSPAEPAGAADQVFTSPSGFPVLASLNPVGIDRPALQPPAPLAALWSTRLADRAPEFARAVFQGTTPLIEGKQVISYYGNPYSAAMGILGTADLSTIAAQLEQRAETFDELNGPLGVIPAIHLVYEVAQPHPTDNGLYLQYVPDADVRRYIEFTRKHGMLLFLDLQIGRSSVGAEVEKVLPFLRYPNVHLALDPEFAVSSPDIPGKELGDIHASDIDEAQAMLRDLVEREGLPPKLLIVHQFADSMLRDVQAIGQYPGVQLIIDMDGFGLAAIKRATYEEIASRPYASRAGIKLFLQHDPDLMSEEDVLQLQPTPTVVIYQ